MIVVLQFLFIQLHETKRPFYKRPFYKWSDVLSSFSEHLQTVPHGKWIWWLWTCMQWFIRIVCGVGLQLGRQLAIPIQILYSWRRMHLAMVELDFFFGSGSNTKHTQRDQKPCSIESCKQQALMTNVKRLRGLIEITFDIRIQRQQPKIQVQKQRELKS